MTEKFKTCNVAYDIIVTVWMCEAWRLDVLSGIELLSISSRWTLRYLYSSTISTSPVNEMVSDVTVFLLKSTIISFVLAQSAPPAPWVRYRVKTVVDWRKHEKHNGTKSFCTDCRFKNFTIFLKAHRFPQNTKILFYFFQTQYHVNWVCCYTRA